MDILLITCPTLLARSSLHLNFRSLSGCHDEEFGRVLEFVRLAIERVDDIRRRWEVELPELSCGHS